MNRHVRTDKMSTRERILYEASRLFAKQGYHGTTTREIAAAVGVRQPSLFHHFPTKKAMMQALLTHDLDAFSFVESLANAEGPASDRLYRYIQRDVELVANSPYNLSGLYTEEVMGDPDFADLAARGDRLHDAVEKMIRDGIATGEFVKTDPALVREGIYGLLLRIMTLYSPGRSRPKGTLGDEVASFILRGLLVEPDRISGLSSS